MRVLVTGAAGMLGSAVVPRFLAAGHDVLPSDIDLSNPQPWGVAAPPLAYLDVRDRGQVQEAFRQGLPDLVLHLAAETSLEVCDADHEHAWLTNTVATRYVALEARRAGVPMVYISTAGVFDGLKDEPYTEFDTPNPVNMYGRSKHEGELAVRELVPEHYVVRAGWMVGGGAGKDHKFVAKILDQLEAGATRIHAVTDKLGTPTYTDDFADCLLDLVASGLAGTYHMVCGGEGSRYDVAARILEVLGREDVELVAVESDFFAADYPSVRPRSEIMRNLLLDLQGMNTMRPWPVALEEYLLTRYAVSARPGPWGTTSRPVVGGRPVPLPRTAVVGSDSVVVG